ncbi:MAG: 7-carboxy-7-deazaguanine synthase [ANME-2 cluster archaeon]|nr:7-carboxy-7-deazaguanine synthase [ANME-2 cluster archaeon]
MQHPSELARCNLCEWRCGVNRLEGERGVCRAGMHPLIAYTMLSETLSSYSVTMLGCNFRCIYCNAYRISQYPDAQWFYRDYVEPSVLADETISRMKPDTDKIGFTGGEPTIHLPYIEEVVRAIREKGTEIGVGIATNGFCTPETLTRVIDLATSISFEIKAYDDDVHRMLTGAPSAPVLRNAKVLATTARESIRVFRTVVIPGITDRQVLKIAAFIADVDPTIPYRLIGFRPNFILYYHPGPSMALMNDLTEQCKDIGLTDVAWSGYYPTEMPGGSETEIAAQYLRRAGCHKYPRSCGECELKDQCPACLLEPWR